MKFKSLVSKYNPNLTGGNINLPIKVLTKLNKSFGIPVVAFYVTCEEKKILCGVREYSAQNGHIEVPFKDFEGKQCTIELASNLSQATRAVFGIDSEFDKVEDKISSIYHSLSGRTVLSVGDILYVGDSEIDVLELEPNGAYVTDCDIDIEFRTRKSTVKNNVQTICEVLNLEDDISIVELRSDSYTYIIGAKTFSVEANKPKPIALERGTYHVYTFDGEKATIDVSKPIGVLCKSCDSYIPNSSSMMHNMRCSRIYTKCMVCEDPVRKGADHVHCELCNMPHESIDDHMELIHRLCVCGSRLTFPTHVCDWECKYCKLKHNPSLHEICASKTTKCDQCDLFVKFMDLDSHSC